MLVKMPAMRHKHLKLDQDKIDRARRLMQAKTEQETIERARDLVLADEKIIEADKKARGVGGVDDVFGR